MTQLNLAYADLTAACATGKPDGIDDMLRATAAAAMRMPSHETMEIWNGEKGLIKLYKYQRPERGQPAVATWRGTWDLTLRPLVMKA